MSDRVTPQTEFAPRVLEGRVEVCPAGGCIVALRRAPAVGTHAILGLGGHLRPASSVEGQASRLVGR